MKQSPTEIREQIAALETRLNGAVASLMEDIEMVIDGDVDTLRRVASGFGEIADRMGFRITIQKVRGPQHKNLVG
jgi:hypothetical protein